MNSQPLAGRRGGRTALDRDLIGDGRLDLSADRRARPTVLDIVRARVIDAELGGLLWVLLDGGVPIVVAGPGEDPAALRARSDVLAAILELVPASRSRRTLAGETEDFAWLGGAEELGWRRVVPPVADPDDPAATVILAGEIGAGPPADTIGDRARLVVRAAGRGYAVAATARAARLEDLIDLLRKRPLRVTDDELARLGIVLFLDGRPLGDRDSKPGPNDSEPGRPPWVGSLHRVVAAHAFRPVARDVHGHSQRLPPAVLATWDDRIARFEHFSWGVAGELAARVGRRTGDYEVETARRAAALEALAANSGTSAADPAGISLALERVRLAGLTTAGIREH